MRKGHHKPTAEVLRHGEAFLKLFSPCLSGSVVDSSFVGIAQIPFHGEVFFETMQAQMVEPR